MRTIAQRLRRLEERFAPAPEAAGHGTCGRAWKKGAFTLATLRPTAVLTQRNIEEAARATGIGAPPCVAERLKVLASMNFTKYTVFTLNPVGSAPVV